MPHTLSDTTRDRILALHELQPYLSVPDLAAQAGATRLVVRRVLRDHLRALARTEIEHLYRTPDDRFEGTNRFRSAGRAGAAPA